MKFTTPVVGSFAVSCLIGALIIQGLVAETSAGNIPVKATVYYESKCPDSRNFIVGQLLPAMLRAPELIHPVLIPYGKATTTETEGNYEFSCQHGTTECHGNKLHACALSITHNTEQQVSFAACMMSHYSDLNSTASNCARALGIPWQTVDYCANDATADVLLNAYGVVTKDLDPPLDFVPTVLLNGERRNQTAILNDFWGEVVKVSAIYGTSSD